VASEIPLCPLRNSFSTPGNKDALRQPRIDIGHLDKSKLDFPFRKLFNEIGQFALLGDELAHSGGVFWGYKEPTSAVLNLEDAFFTTSILLKRAHQGGGNGEDGPFGKGRRAPCGL
jgi:hypothetical protein